MQAAVEARFDRPGELPQVDGVPASRLLLLVGVRNVSGDEPGDGERLFPRRCGGVIQRVELEVFADLSRLGGIRDGLNVEGQGILDIRPGFLERMEESVETGLVGPVDVYLQIFGHGIDDEGDEQNAQDGEDVPEDVEKRFHGRLFELGHPLNHKLQGLGSKGFFDVAVFRDSPGGAVLEEVGDTVDGFDLVLGRGGKTFAQRAEVAFVIHLDVLRAIQGQHGAGNAAQFRAHVQ